MKKIEQTIEFNVSPKEFYDAFMNSEIHSAFTGSEAIISKEINGEFSAHGGYCFGKNLELVEGAKIVQSWQAYDDNWEEGHFSKITLFLEAKGTGTTLKFIHEAVPDLAEKSIANGWNEFYWEPMKNYFANR